MQVSIRYAIVGDAEEIAKLYWRAMLSIERLGLIRLAIHQYPAYVAELSDQLVGFAYSRPFAPDILEIDNLFVDENYRGEQIGTRLLLSVEAEASKQYASIILVNSELYDNAVVDKKPATKFYLRNGYSLIASTGPTRVFTKSLMLNR